jgi:predicted amidohydrolase YtcJ
MRRPADIIITNARAITLDLEHPYAEAGAVSGQRIA